MAFFSPSMRMRLMCVWAPQPAEPANGLDMKDASSPSLRAISLTPFLKLNARSGPAMPAPGA